MTRVVVVGALSLSVFACGPGPGPAAFSKDFKTSSGYFTLMSKPVDNSGMDAATFVHKLQRTWYSTNVQGALGGNDLPAGTVAVKETYDANNNPSNVLFMIKKSKDTWYYEMRDKDGNELAMAPKGDNVAMCLGCHTKFKDKDYLGGTTVKN